MVVSGMGGRGVLMSAVVMGLLKFGFLLISLVVVGRAIHNAVVANRGSVAVCTWARERVCC